MSRYVFGPVPSRRLGRSLGVDLIPFKTCSYDCIYCQLGPTTCKTMERKEYVPLEEVLGQLGKKLSTSPDYITLSGSGEPTLYSRLGELIDRIKAMTPIPVAVLTNSSLLWRQDVREELARADLVAPSLDAGDEAMFRAVNRPHESISFEKMLEGLATFAAEHKGQLWLEVFILKDYTTDDAELARLIRCVRRVHPQKVQLNTVTRPPAEDYAIAVDRERLEEIAKLFEPKAEVVAEFPPSRQAKPDETGAQDEFSVVCDEVLDLIRRRPCSLDDLVVGLRLDRNELVKCLSVLTSEGRIAEARRDNKTYYKAA